MADGPTVGRWGLGFVMPATAGSQELGALCRSSRPDGPHQVGGVIRSPRLSKKLAAAVDKCCNSVNARTVIRETYD